MRVPVQWLKEYVDYPWSTEELAHRLTMSGLKVEAVERPGELWGDVVIGEVESLQPHPKSNKPLHVATVRYGEETVTVVTGAQNLYAGARAPLVLEGGSVPFGPGDEPLTIVPRPMAGITSHGMLCSTKELGLGEDHSGILILPSEAPVGRPLAEYLGSDVLDIETVSNRPDTLSMLGVAREVAALVPTDMSQPDLSQLPPTVEHIDEDSIGIEIVDPDLCPRYTALRVDGISAGESPEWLARRLEAAGMRPINLLVDLTNYVMHEYGQPMHAFDASRLHGDTIVVRRARDGETLMTLDGIERILGPDNLVIADGERPVAIAGVMGGEDSEITPGTTSLILESANFNAPSVRRTAQALGLRTDASSRFEKGLPPEGTVPAIERYVQLLSEITGAPLQIARMSDRWPVKPQPRVVVMPLRDLSRLLGIEVSVGRAAKILRTLGFGVTVGDESIEAEVPPWRRVDIHRSADLVEEVGRIVGFDEIPSTLPFRTLEPPVPSPEWYWENRLRDRLTAVGLNEGVTHTLSSPALMSRLHIIANRSNEAGVPWDELVPNREGIDREGATPWPISLMNPGSMDRQLLRLTLLPSLLDVAAHNFKHTEERVEFFEIARTFFPREDDQLPYERRTLSLVLSGRRVPRTWQDTNPGSFSFFDVKGVIEAVLDELQISNWSVRPKRHPSLHPGRSAALCLGDQDVAYFGELHPTVAARFELEGRPTQVAEIDLDALFPHASSEHVFQPLPRFPAAYRDLAVVVTDTVAADDIVRLVRAEGGQVLESAQIFDVYEGGSLPQGTRSIAVQIVFRSPERTLTQEEVDAVVSRIIAALAREFGASLRD